MFSSLRAIVATMVVSGVLIAQPASAGQPSRDGTEGRQAARETIAESSPSSRELRTMDSLEHTRSLARFLDLSGELYCLGLGFVDGPPDYAALAATIGKREVAPTGDLSFGSWVAQRLTMTDAERIKVEQEEIDTATAAVAKTTTINRSLDRADQKSSAAAGTQLDPPGQNYPAERFIMGGFHTRQIDSAWCGPATMQSIDWADDNQRDTQASWAADLGTTGQGTGITAMVQQINVKTTWDTKAGGPYTAHSVTELDAGSFYFLHKQTIGDSDPSPIVEHPMLRDEYFNYLNSDHSGHFQVGRGYRSNANWVKYIGIFEVFNESDWSFGGNETWGPREVISDKMLGATKVHPLHNVGY